MSAPSDLSFQSGSSWREPPAGSSSQPAAAGDGGSHWPATTSIKKVCVMGASGLLGRALCASLERAGVEVQRFSRGTRPGFVHWDPATGELDAACFSGVDAVVNLSGEDLAERRWTPA